MHARSWPTEFLVAFSLAGEQRDLVRAIAEAVERRLGYGTVFFDEWFEHYLSGDDADLKLQNIYGGQCSLAVWCVSKEYGGKPWTRTEHSAIRARMMKARAASDQRERNGVLPIRVGDGDVEGLLFNTIAPDVRNRSVDQAADLIVERFYVVEPALRPAPVAAPVGPQWPAVPPSLSWPMADHSGAREEFGLLLTAATPHRYLPIRGETDTGKSHITRQMLANALAMPDIACGRFDFKGTTDVDREVMAFVQELGIPLPAPAARLDDRLSQILRELKQRAHPTLLIFDTFELAGEAVDWIDKQLLPSLIRADWLRVVIAGQKVPESAGAVWMHVAQPTLQLVASCARDWVHFGRERLGVTTFPTLTEGERTELKTTLEAASIPHWCDADMLAALLEIPVEASRERLARLRQLKVVEPFPARGEQAVNVYKAARLALRHWLAAQRPESFRTWSQRAADHFAADADPPARIEWIYHRLGYDPDRAATELECLDRDWSGSARPEHHQALAIALQELLEANALDGRAQVWAMLCVAWARDARGETAQLGDQARFILDIAVGTRDQAAIAMAQRLLGDVFQSQGKLIEAQAAFEKSLAISRLLALHNPSDGGRQRDLAFAHCQVGDVFQTQGKLSKAQTEFGEFLVISRRLARHDPGNAGWQRSLAAAHSRVGAVLQTQGKLREATAAFGESLAISRRLAEQDPSNACWQEILAVSNSQFGDVLQEQGELSEAHASYGESLVISRRLAEQDPNNAYWQQILAAAHSRIGSIFQAKGELIEAHASYGESLAILRSLAEQDPSNAYWQQSLATAHSQIGSLFQAQGELIEAHASYGENLAILRRLAEQDPSNAYWQQNLAAAHSQIGSLFQAQGELVEAHASYREYLAISRGLAEQDPTNADWQRNLARAHGQIGSILETQGELIGAQTASREYLAISQRLAEQDPTNADWQRELAVAHSRVGSVLQAQGKLCQAQAAFGKSLAMLQRLVEQDPSNAYWQHTLAAVHSQIGSVFQTQGKLIEAHVAYGEYLVITRRLAEQDPSKRYCQWELAVAHFQVGNVLQAQGRLGDAQAAFWEFLEISWRLAEQDPSNVGWQRDLAVGCLRVAQLRSVSGKYQDALPLYEEAARIFVDLVERCPDVAAWRGERDAVQRELEVCRTNIRSTP